MAADDTPNWERRFLAPDVSFPDWAPGSPDRLVLATTESGVWQLHAWDRATSSRRRVTDHPVGVLSGAPTLDGRSVLWFQDETGDESGRWLKQPFEGGPTEPLLEGLPAGWTEGLAQAPGITAAGVSDRDGFVIFTALEGEPAKELYRSTDAVRLAAAESTEGTVFNRAALSADGSLLCLEHSEHGDLIRPSLRAVDPRTGAVIGELHDPGQALASACWSPIAGDARLAVVEERTGEERPALWDLSTGERRTIELPELQGPVTIHDWWPDASTLLLGNLHEGRDHLYRFDIDTEALTPIPAPDGGLTNARVRPDGTLWLRHLAADRPPQILDHGGRRLPEPAGAP